MGPASLRTLALRVAVSLLLAGVFYLAWMSVFILTYHSAGPGVRAFLWIAGPPVVAAGFALGLMLFRWKARRRRIEFLRCYIWPLVGCAIGTAVVFPFGPMLIVFGIFILGTLAVTIYEGRLMIRSDPGTRSNGV